MMDVLHGVLTWVDYNRGKVAGAALAIVLFAWLVGCQSKTMGLSGKKVTARELDMEMLDARTSISKRVAQYAVLGKEIAADLDAVEAKEVFAREDLARQDAFKQQALEIGGGLIGAALSGGAVNWAQAVPTLLLMLGAGVTGGAVVDGTRKDGVIMRKDSELAAVKSNGGVS